MEINEKKLNPVRNQRFLSGVKEILTNQREDYQRYLGALTENFESQV